MDNFQAHAVDNNHLKLPHQMCIYQKFDQCYLIEPGTELDIIHLLILIGRIDYFVYICK